MTQNLHPTEISFLESPKEYSFQLFFVQTFINLLANDVLALKEKEIQRSRFLSKITIVVPGSRIKSYLPKEFEKAFVADFQVNITQQFELDKYIFGVLSIVKEKWKNQLYESKQLIPYFNNNYALNEEGKRLSNLMLFNIAKGGERILESNFFQVTVLNSSSYEDNEMDSNKRKKRLYVSNFFKDISPRKIDFIYTRVIDVYSAFQKPDDRLKWGNYGAGNS